MATITLYSGKINTMPTLISDVKTAVSDLKRELQSFGRKCKLVNRSVCDMDDIVQMISTSTQTQDDKVTSLDSLKTSVEEFANEVSRIDGKVADYVNECKEDFYDKYSYLKPECEKNGWDKFCDGCAKVAEWCKDHWKAVVTVVLVIASIALIICTAGAALGPITALLVVIAKGILIGTVIGGLAGGISNVLINNGSFWEGLENGAFGGAISGALTAGLGSWASAGGKVALTLGKTVLIAGTSEAGSSLLGSLGDTLIKGEDISFGDVLFDMGFSFALGSAMSFVGSFLPKITIKGISKGNGSWAHVWATQSARSMNQGSKISMKSILKGIGSEAVSEGFSHIIELVKALISELRAKRSKGTNYAEAY